ncbi:MAG: RAD55 family ATPase [Euryarchaeota archaeon]|nr:RAD55 family ATPase [Euryarchaeota archaeon]
MKNVKTGIELLDSLLPEGMPKDNFIGLFGEGGTGKSVILYEILYKRLKMSEPGIFVCFEDVPRSILEHTKNFGWDLTTFANFKFLDCYSFRMEKRSSSNSIKTMTHPSNLDLLTDVLFDMIDDLDMQEKGIVILDSLTELMTISNVPELVDTLKDWRAKGPKERGITFMTSVHYGLKMYSNVVDTFDYIMDGLIDLRYNPEVMKKSVLLKELRIRKMKGTSHITSWVPFEITEKGMKKIKKGRES